MKKTKADNTIEIHKEHVRRVLESLNSGNMSNNTFCQH